MTGFYRLHAALCSVFVLWLGFTGPAMGAEAPAEEGKTVRIATGEWLPYVSETQPYWGALGHIITTAFNRAGYQVKFQNFPWARGYQLVKDGVWDATMPYYCSPEREQEFYCSNPLVSGEQVFFHLKEVPVQWEQLSDLKGYSIGATLGYYYGEAFEQAEISGELMVKRIASDEKNMQLLLMGRIKLFPQDKEVGYSTVRHMYPHQKELLTHHPRPIHTKTLHLIFPRDNPSSPELLKVFNAQLVELKREGIWDQYMRAMRDGDYEKPASEIKPPAGKEH
ncbi:ABC transporter substrate-binding protein [Hahella sp. KA22]|uniref:substrate-binding periplasmic protein n=1 Tax=Hahella sp. KA22 TaxID=1628392 RepID=UPI001F4DA285|nr:transporter substrate-binding domain-containing protein [Hahella sp. KA22]